MDATLSYENGIWLFTSTKADQEKTVETSSTCADILSSVLYCPVICLEEKILDSERRAFSVSQMGFSIYSAFNFVFRHGKMRTTERYKYPVCLCPDLSNAVAYDSKPPQAVCRV